MDSQPIQVATVSDEVYTRLHQAITSGALMPGMKLTIRSIAESFHVSTMPVRDALRRLEATGLVVFGRRSVTVTLLSPDEVEQVFQIRLRLEQLAAEWAIPRIRPQDLDDLEHILAQMDDPTLSADQWRVLNQQFHLRFYERAESEHLLRLIRDVWNKVEPYMAIYASRVDDFAEAQQQHRFMLDLIRRGDLSGLLMSTAHHLDYTAQTVVSALIDPAVS